MPYYSLGFQGRRYKKSGSLRDGIALATELRTAHRFESEIAMSNYQRVKRSREIARELENMYGIRVLYTR